MPPRKRNSGEIYVATESFVCELDGERIVVNAGERVRAGHKLLDAHAGAFKPIDVHYEVEQATAAPGEKRA